jgi:hypothetical protein
MKELGFRFFKSDLLGKKPEEWGFSRGVINIGD